MPYNQTRTYGNLLSYKAYTKPAANKLYGYMKTKRSVHQKNVHDLLHILFTKGTRTAWAMARVNYSEIDVIRTQEKIYRRLLIGRTDKERHTGGIIDLGLVVKAEDTRPYAKYRLTPYGILYCLDVLEPTKEDIDAMADSYSFLMPKIFGRWKKIKKKLGDDAYNLAILAKGVYLNNVKVAQAENPLYELMSFVHIKYKENFESIDEDDLTEQMSYWFYTFLLYQNPDLLKKVLAYDDDLKSWYVDFFNQAKSYYADRLQAINNADIF